MATRFIDVLVTCPDRILRKGLRAPASMSARACANSATAWSHLSLERRQERRAKSALLKPGRPFENFGPVKALPPTGSGIVARLALPREPTRSVWIRDDDYRPRRTADARLRIINFERVNRLVPIFSDPSPLPR